MASGSSLFNAETCRLILGLFDRDHDGLIGFPEFEGLWYGILVVASPTGPRPRALRH
jgi:hypothetical protein